MPYRCDNCEDSGWVCEDHPQHPWPKCKCGGAGMWCPECRPTTEEPEEMGMSEIPEDIRKMAEAALRANRYSRDDAGYNQTRDLVAAAILAERKRWKALEFTGPALISIIEGIQGAMEHGDWRDQKGMRLKDTNEWVAFYTTLKSAIRGEA